MVLAQLPSCSGAPYICSQQASSWRLARIFSSSLSIHSSAQNRSRNRNSWPTTGEDNEQEEEENDKRNFVVKVYARFRDGSNTDDEGSATVATIPLHQRLAMLRTQHNCSNSEALRLLWARGSSALTGGASTPPRANAAKDSGSVLGIGITGKSPVVGASIDHDNAEANASSIPLSSSPPVSSLCSSGTTEGTLSTPSSSPKSSSSVLSPGSRKRKGSAGVGSPPRSLALAIPTPSDPWEHAFLPEDDTPDKCSSICSWRLPLRAHNKDNAFTSPQKAQPVIDAHAHVGILAIRPKQVVVCAPSMGVRSFRFERVFPPTAPQSDVYDVCARHVVADFINGINGCIFAYGQTGSGKTFTMFGPNSHVSSSLSIESASGLAPRVFADILQAMEARRNWYDTSLDFSYVEVFGNELNDLLRGGAAIGAWHGIAVRHVMEGLTSIPVTCAQDVEGLLRKAEGDKRRAATAMNERSSRAHSVLIIHLRQEHRSTGQVLDNRLCIADLGGSEQVKKSRVVGDQLVEAVNINLGLLALKTCMTALRRHKTHVPFNDSVLTMLLENSVWQGKEWP